MVLADGRIIAGGVVGWPSQYGVISAAGGLEVVGSTVATTPPSLGSDGGIEIIVPVPAGVQPGNWLIAGLYVSRTGNNWPLIPAGWSTLQNVGNFSGIHLGIFGRQADGTELSSYTWWGGDSGFSRGGAMIAVRNASAINQSSAATGTFTVPDMAGAPAGSMLIAFSTCRSGDASENWTAIAPLSLQEQHVTLNGGAPYGLSAGMAMAFEENCEGLIDGRTFTKSPYTVPSAGGVILEP